MSSEVAIVAVGSLLPQGESASGLDAVLAGQSAAAPWADDPRYVVGAISEDRVAVVPGEDRAVTLALRAAEQAMSGGGWESAADDPMQRLAREVARERFGCVFTISKGGLDLLDRRLRLGQGPRPGEAAMPMSVDPAAATRRIAQRFDLCGPSLTMASACASGGHALARSRRLILEGRADAVLCGAADASLQPLVLASYERLGLLGQLARCGGDPAKLCRPFAADRDGFFVGEGAAAFVLTSLEIAERLGLRVLARLASSASGATAAGLMTMPTDGEALARVGAAALHRAGIEPGQVDLVSLHGTATIDGDLNEVRALERIFGARAAEVPVMATKGLHGHLLGAACAAESALLVRSMATGQLPPTFTGLRAGPDGRIEFTTSAPRRTTARISLKLSAGFGGHICALVFRSE
ncbi:MAG: hypothetical protein GWP05_08335 [Anaerolineaceae bacterium]|nr:hypothetical protein [Anaerolineaceae bacterium]